LLINRHSRSGALHGDAICARLREHGLELDAPDLSGADDVPAMIRRHADRVDLVIVGGGDGSMNAAAPALVETGLPLGVLPLGTANDLARTLDIPIDVEQACDTACTGVPHRIDLGMVNGKPFFNVAHVGLAVRVMDEMSAGSKRHLGVLAYPLSVLRALRSIHAFRVQVMCDGRARLLRTIQLSIGNGRHFGGGMTVAAPARIDDGSFFLCSVRPLGWREGLRALTRLSSLRAGEFTACDPVYVEQGRRIEVRTRVPMAVSADGELVAHTPAVFELLAGAIEVFVPPAYLMPTGEEEAHVAQG